MKSRCFFLALALGGSGLCQVTTSRFQNRDAWTLEGPQLRVTMLQSGGHIGEIVLKGADAINPLWLRLGTVEPDQYDPAKQRGGKFMSGLLGHNVCFPYWGDPSPAERAAGMQLHGETGVLRWRMVSSGGDWLTASAELPESGTRFTRTVRLSGQIVGFEETAENLSGLDRIVGWCQHVSIGAPFMDSSGESVGR